MPSKHRTGGKLLLQKHFYVFNARIALLRRRPSHRNENPNGVLTKVWNIVNQLELQIDDSVQISYTLNLGRPC